ncbi:TPA: hypothetical protein EYP66_15010 [Candidatus Poribacteria bacterium]|nr:hypothetical protein [Candidatus Poribacteria bacterium]
MTMEKSTFGPDFFYGVEPIKLKDPLAITLGAAKPDEFFVYTYADAVKMAGHSCPVVAGAYKLTQIALGQLYGDETPIRGDIKVTFRSDLDFQVNGPISQVVSLITGAAGESGFHGIGGQRKFSRYNLLTFDGENEPEYAVCSVLFERIDTGEKVEITYDNEMLPWDDRLNELMPPAVRGTANAEQLALFGQLWQERVRIVLQQPPEGMFTVKVLK